MRKVTVSAYQNALRSEDNAVASSSFANVALLESSVNFRDISSASPKIKPGLVFRSSQLVSTMELATLKIQTVLDLRQAPVLCKAQRHNFWESVKRTWMACVTTCFGRGQGGEGSVSGRSGSSESLANPSLVRRQGSAGVSTSTSSGRPLLAVKQYRRHIKHAAPCWRCTAACDQQYGVEATVFHVDLLPRGVSLHILFSLPRRLQAKVLVCALQGGQPEPLVAGAVADDRVMGYLRLYQILLDKSKESIAKALRLFADAANLPLLVHCIHGKDRTGLIVMLLLLLCNVDREVIIQDYAMSEVLLRESRERRHLEGLQAYLTTDQVIAATRHVMDSTIKYLFANYGSAQRYAMDIGLTYREIAAIRRNLLYEEHLNQ